MRLCIDCKVAEAVAADWRFHTERKLRCRRCDNIRLIREWTALQDQKKPEAGT